MRWQPNFTAYAWKIGESGKGDSHACNCIGPQPGKPRCPCMMRNVQIIDGRYVQVTDLGPAPEPAAKREHE